MGETENNINHVIIRCNIKVKTIMSSRNKKHSLSIVAEQLALKAEKTNNAMQSLQMLKGLGKLQTVSKNIDDGINNMTKDIPKSVLIKTMQKIAKTPIVKLKPKSFFYNQEVAITLQQLQNVAIQKCQLIMNELGMEGHIDTYSLWADAYKSAEDLDGFEMTSNHFLESTTDDHRDSLKFKRCTNSKLSSYTYMNYVFEYVIKHLNSDKDDVLNILLPMVAPVRLKMVGVFGQIEKKLNVQNSHPSDFSIDDLQFAGTHHELSVQQVGHLQYLGELLGCPVDFANHDTYIGLQKPRGLFAYHTHLPGYTFRDFKFFRKTVPSAKYPNIIPYLQMLYNALYETIYPLVCAMDMIRKRTFELLCNDDNSQIELCLTYREVIDLGDLVKQYVVPFSNLKATMFDSFYQSCKMLQFLRRKDTNFRACKSIHLISMLQKIDIPKMYEQAFLQSPRKANTNKK